MTFDPNRPDKLLDLTRWNRAGLSRLQYVDGDAATWLEELRIAMLGLAARGAAFEERLPETWRFRFSDEEEWPPEPQRAAFLDKLVWKTIARAYPDRPETARKRNARLLEQYGAKPSEYGWEIMRAAARAAHVLLGHQNAYANEGYLRTATQWENLRRLAEMVNHQPAPPTSAVTTVGLMLAGDATPEDEPVEIARGLAMKFTPPEGGSPVVYETLKPLKCHPTLNDARVADWDYDSDPLTDGDLWVAPEEAALAPGGLVVIETATGLLANALTGVTLDADETLATLNFSEPIAGVERGEAILWAEAKAVRRGAPRATIGVDVVRIDTASSYSVNAVVFGLVGGAEHQLAVAGAADGHLKLTGDSLGGGDGDEVVIETLTPITSGGGLAPGSLGVSAFFVNSNLSVGSGTGVVKYVLDEDGDATSLIEGIDFSSVSGGIGGLFGRTGSPKRETGVFAGVPPAVIPGAHHPRRLVRFTGKPPKGLAVGDLMVMRALDGGALTPLRVSGVAVNADDYVIQFEHDVTTNADTFRPDRHEFHGPMIRALRPLDFDRSPEPAFMAATALLPGLTTGARSLLRVGRQCLIEDERGAAPPVLATISDLFDGAGALEVSFASALGLDAFIAGWTTLNFNAVQASHGETKSPKALGSGDGEKARQTFPFTAKEVSFIPSTVAETGVAPDMDVAVEGVLWTYRDLIDPTAEGTESFSTSVTEDGGLTIHFRRRLPTGQNNLVVRRHRTGVGPRGAVPARAFTKPMKKNRHVKAITQPFASSGGAEREPVEAIRTNAPARLAANDRAVSLKDFERLCVRRSDILQAAARAVPDPATPEDVAIVVVPANGGTLAPDAEADLIDYLEARALPGVKVAIEPFDGVGLVIAATIYVEVEKFDKTEVQEAAQAALAAAFALAARRLGQTAYISEVAAALERVEGVRATVVDSIGLYPAGKTILRTAVTDGEPSAFVPFANQVIAIAPDRAGADIAIAVEAF